MLHKDGFDAEDVREIGMGSASDDQIVDHATRENQVIVTRDTDFGSVLRHPDHLGALILRLPHRFTAPEINERLGCFLSQVKEDVLRNAVVIVELGRFRRRPID